MLVFATVAALSLSHEWGMSYAELIPYATPGFVTFSVMASSVPLIAWIHARWGFDSLFSVLAAAACIFTAVFMLPRAVSAKVHT
jgi:hypothetical protein